MKQKLTFKVLIFSLIILIPFIGFNPIDSVKAASYVDVPIQTAYDMINNQTLYPNLIILDVREQFEYDESHLVDAILIPRGEIDIRINELEPFRETEILVYCRSGSRSALASQNLAGNHNFTKIFNMLGGITEWIASGYPIWTPNNGNGLPTIKFSVNLFIIIILGTLGLIIIYYKSRILFINKN